jgi:AcrR family transcriptional regulator
MPNTSQGASPGVLRRIPKQERSRERIDEILKVSMELIGSKGIDAVTMKEIAALSGGPIASVYQYFPNKSAIVATLYKRYAEDVKGFVESCSSGIETPQDAFSAVTRLLDLYYQSVREQPAIQDLLNATLADKALALLDLEASRIHSEIFTEATIQFVEDGQSEAYRRKVFLMFHLAAAAVRLSLLVGDEEAKGIMADFTAASLTQMRRFIAV